MFCFLKYRYAFLNSIIYIFLTGCLLGQDKVALDSLNLQKESTVLPVKIKALNELCRIYTGIDNSKAMYYSKLALQHSAISKDVLLMAQSLNRVGTIYDYRGIIDSANINYLEALKIFEEYKDKSGIASVYQNIGVMYYFQNDLDRSIEYYLKAIALRNETQELDFVAKLQNNIAVILRRQKKYNQAIDFYNKALAIKLKFNDKEAIANAYSNLASVYSYKELTDSAKFFLDKAITLNKEMNSSINLAGNYLQLAELFFSERNYKEARIATLMSIDLAKAAESNDVLYNSYEVMWNIDTANKDFRSAILNKHIASQYKAKVFKDEKAKAIERLNVLYETEKKDKEIITLNARQEKEKTQKQLLLIGLGLTLIILTITAIYFKKLHSKNKLLSFQKREIQDKTALLNQQASEIAQYRTQMNPHFIFNALVTIQKFILRENKFNASHYLTQLSKLMRLTLYNSEKEFITIKEEREFLDLYIEFERSRFENSFTYVFHLDETIDENNILIPPMIFQPFIENAIKHGFSAKANEDRIDIFITNQSAGKQPYLLIEINDNGVGREAANRRRVNDTEHKSKGLDITIQRIKTACIANEITINDHFEIIDLKNNNVPIGTQVKIKLPLIENF